MDLMDDDEFVRDFVSRRAAHWSMELVDKTDVARIAKLRADVRPVIQFAREVLLAELRAHEGVGIPLLAQKEKT